MLGKDYWSEEAWSALSGIPGHHTAGSPATVALSSLSDCTYTYNENRSVLILVLLFAKKIRSNVRLVKKKCSNHPDWATGRPSGSPLAAFIIFDLFFLSLNNSENCVLTITFYRTSSYPNVRSPPSSNRYLGLFAKTCQDFVIHCTKVKIGGSCQTYLEIHIGEVSGTKPGVFHPKVLWRVDNPVNCLKKRY